MGRPRTVDLPVDELKRFSEQGATLREIASYYGCSRQCVCSRMTEAGIPRLPPYSLPGKMNGAWKGGKYLVKGYWMIWSPDHPNATKDGRVAEHRLVMEHHIGRYLTREEVVHHINGNRTDNRIENLVLFSSNAEHLRAELSGKIPNWTEDGLRRILKSNRQKRSR